MPRPLHVFAIAQHAHAIGRWLWAEQYRDGEFVGLFATENAAYDFNVQVCGWLEGGLAGNWGRGGGGTWTERRRGVGV